MDPEVAKQAAANLDAAYEPGKDVFEVTQYGARRIWDEAERAFGCWVEHGRPAADRFGLLVSAGGERLWLDDPARLI